MKQTRLSFCREETGGILHWKHYPVYCSHLNSLQERVFIVSCLGIALDHIILLLRVVSEGKGGCLSRQPPPPGTLYITIGMSTASCSQNCESEVDGTFVWSSC